MYWRGGALLNTITEPRFHLKMPLITQFEPIQVTLQVRDIPCGTKGGVRINFEKIEVVTRLHKDYVYETLLNYGVQYVNTWIYDKIYHEINQFCSAHSFQQVYIDMFDQIDEKMKDALQSDCERYAPGIEIISVRVTKPTIPESIMHKFEQLEQDFYDVSLVHGYNLAISITPFKDLCIFILFYFIFRFSIFLFFIYFILFYFILFYSFYFILFLFSLFLFSSFQF